MQVEVYTQPTPNPNAMKFILNREVKNSGKVSFDSPESCAKVPLAEALLQLPHVVQVHFFENVISVTQDGSVDWDHLCDEVRSTIQENFHKHDPNFEMGLNEADRRSMLSEDIQKIESILDRTIRPGLQSDGGDLEVIEFDGVKNLVVVQYQGACGSCPSSTMGTLMAIQGILRDEFNPDVEVVPL